MDGRTIRSIARRFAAVGAFRPRLTSLKHEAYCRRHLGKKLGVDTAYVRLIRAYVDFLRCSYSTQNESTQNLVVLFANELTKLCSHIEKVSTGARRAVPSRVVARVGAMATLLRRNLRGSRNVKDCRDDWISFGLIYHAVF